jgi:BirA family biotin operon repressor/biotin-[acetyl-CoA-carboxylase] ligase
MFDTQKFQKALRTQYIGRCLVYRKEIDSTMNLAHREIHEGATTGTIVLAERQTRGKGRKGRPWISELGGNLYFSIIFRVNPQEPLHLLKLNFAVAAAIVQACRNEGVQDTFIKWPNDIWIKGQSEGEYKKVAGMLIDSVQTEGELSASCGVGINVNQDMALVHDQIEGNIPISLSNVLCRSIDREQLLAKICNSLEHLLGESLESVVELYKSFDILVGKQVIVQSMSASRTGQAIGFSKFGNLVVKFDEDNVKELISEEVSIRTTTDDDEL